VVERGDHPAGLHVRIIEHFAEVVERPDRHAAGVARAHEGVAIHPRDRGAQRLHDLVAALHATLVRLQVLAGRELREPEDFAQRRPVLVARRDVRPLAVLALERRRRDAARVLSPHAGRHLAEREVAGRGDREQAHLSVEHREVDVAAAPGRGAPVQAREHRDRDPERGRQVGERQAGLDGRAARFARQAHQPAHRLEDRVVAFLVGVRAGLAEAGARHVDDALVPGGDRRVVEAVAAERPDREVLDHDVGLRAQLADEVLTAGLAQVDGHRLLGPVAREVIGRLVAHPRLELAGFVARSRLLDLDDRRAQLRQDHRGVGARQHPGHLDDREPLERPHQPAFGSA